MQVHMTWHRRSSLRWMHLGVAVLCVALSGLAQAEAQATLSDEALEARFWACDVASTHMVLSASDGAQCVRWQDELKARRFDGDFERLLAWWREHKAEQHARRLPPDAGRNAAR